MKIIKYKNKLVEELAIQAEYESSQQDCKDIIIVVHNQLNYFKNCIKSIIANTKNYKLYIWDNASDKETKEFIKTLDATVITSEENIGFIIPNNEIARISKSPYLILLNSDTEVREGWDTSMIGFLKFKEKVKVVGYSGGILMSDGKGYNYRKGKDIDYVCGWCLCVSRDTYKEYGLFDDKNLKFAYCEDSDFSLRLREAGHEIYALHLDYVVHHCNKTIMEVEKVQDIKSSFETNHVYLRNRWKFYLKNCRVEVEGP